MSSSASTMHFSTRSAISGWAYCEASAGKSQQPQGAAKRLGYDQQSGSEVHRVHHVHHRHQSKRSSRGGKLTTYSKSFCRRCTSCRQSRQTGANCEPIAVGGRSRPGKLQAVQPPRKRRGCTPFCSAGCRQHAAAGGSNLHLQRDVHVRDLYRRRRLDHLIQTTATQRRTDVAFFELTAH